MSDRAAALAPYAEQLLNNRDVQDATLQRARGQGPAKARQTVLGLVSNTDANSSNA